MGNNKKDFSFVKTFLFSKIFNENHFRLRLTKDREWETDNHFKGKIGISLQFSLQLLENEFNLRRLSNKTLIC